MSLNFNWVTPMSTGGNNKAQENAIYAKKTKAGRKKENGEVQYQIGLTIPEQAMRKARFVVGDRVEVGFAQDNGLWVIAVRRVISGGYAISSARGGAVDVSGKPVRGKVQMTFRDGMPESFYSDPGSYEIDESGMLIVREAK